MVSGYFCREQKNETYNILLRRKIVHCVKITIVFVLLYLVWDSFSALINGRAIIDSITRVFNITNLISLITCGYLNGLYWFVTILTACYILQYIFRKFNLNRFALQIALLFSIIEIIVSILDKQFDLNIPVYIYKSVWLNGLPFFMIGIYFQNNNTVFNVLDNNTKILIAGLVLLVLQIKEFYMPNVWIGMRNPIILQLYTAVLFFFAIKNPNKYFVKLVEDIGEKYYLFVYIVHSIVAYYLNFILRLVGMIGNAIVLLCYPFIVIGICIILAKIFYSDRLNRLKNKVFREVRF